MAKIDIISGFLGAGKTTLIKKLIAEAFPGEKLVLIENEFGEIGIDGGFLKEAGIQITEMNSGCICCSLVGDFGAALKEVLEKYSPDRVIIEPSGVGKLSDVIKAVQNIGDGVVINSTAVVVDAQKCKMYMKNYGEFYNNQIEYAISNSSVPNSLTHSIVKVSISSQKHSSINVRTLFRSSTFLILSQLIQNGITKRHPFSICRITILLNQRFSFLLPLRIEYSCCPHGFFSCFFQSLII